MPWTDKTAVPGNPPLIRMVPCTFMIQRGCVISLEYLCSVGIYLPLKRLFTDTDMYDPDLREEMKQFYLYLQLIRRIERLTIPSGDYDLVLDIMPTKDRKVLWSYYYACHETRCLFWLEQYDGDHLTFELDGVGSPAHVSESPSSTSYSLIPLIWRTEHRLESLYWYITCVSWLS